MFLAQFGYIGNASSQALVPIRLDQAGLLGNGPRGSMVDPAGGEMPFPYPGRVIGRLMRGLRAGDSRSVLIYNARETRVRSAMRY